jgi:hypothetical protein
MNIIKSTLCLLALSAWSFSAGAHEGEEHGDHNPHHGGFVMMYQDLHFELVARPAGGVEVYYTDAIRNTLPAAIATDVTVEIERAGEQVEYVDMAISDSGDFWLGNTRPIENPQDIIRLGFLFDGTPLILDVRASSMPEPGADDHHGHEGHDSGNMHHGH